MDKAKDNLLSFPVSAHDSAHRAAAWVDRMNRQRAVRSGLQLDEYRAGP
jgi:hypothetical protein